MDERSRGYVRRAVSHIQVEVPSNRHLRTARRAVRKKLLDQPVDERDAWTLETVVAELLGAAYDTDVQSPIVITVDTYARLHTVRLRGLHHPNLDDAPFHLRERILHSLTLAFGERRNADGTTDLWAEVPRTDT